MQTPPMQPPSSLYYTLITVAAFITNPITAFLTWVFIRRKQLAETALAAAQTGKTEAENRQIDSTVITKAYGRLDQLEDIVHKMSIERTIDKQNAIKEAWAKQELEADLKRLTDQLALARAKGFIE